jgi:hypothetical protein
VHAPHEATLRAPPQLSVPDQAPQALPSRLQNVPSLSGVQPHAFGVPPPPQVTPVPVHVPHEATLRAPPQLSVPDQAPHALPSRLQNVPSLSGVQPHAFGVPPPPQVTPVPVHVPHEATLRAAPQLSVPDQAPQALPSREQNVGLSSGTQPQTLTVPPPPHVMPVPVHVPHGFTVRAAPQLSLFVTEPQFLPSREQNVGLSSGVQPHALGVPPPPQVTPVPVHAPHEATVRAPPQLSVPDQAPQALPSRLQNVPSLSGVQPHAFGVPPPPQVTPVPVHVPHEATLRAAPQLSVPDQLPQALPSRLQNVPSLSGVQPHTLLAPQTGLSIGHVPHGFTVRAVPQLSFAVTLPQFLPSRVQKVALSSGVQMHAFPVHVIPVPVHVPHEATLRAAPQLSVPDQAPQALPSRLQKVGLSSGVHPHAFGVPPPPHVTPVPVHAPHEATVRAAPQLSAPDQLPQALPSREQNVGLSSGVQPHTFGVPPPPQVTPVPLHVPHEATVRAAPQLSVPDQAPQALPNRLQKVASLSGMQPHTFAVPPPPQLAPVALQVPQLADREAPQLSFAA